MANPVGSLLDPFTAATLNATLWTGTAGATTVVPALGMAQVAVPTVASTYNTLKSVGVYDATGGVVYAQVTPALRGAGGTVTLLRLMLDSNNTATMQLVGGAFQLVVKNAGTSTTVTLPAFDPTQHAWWRLREQTGVWYAEASPDGYAWTTLGSTTYTWSPTALTVVMQAGATDTEASGLFAGFAHLNTMQGPSGLMPSWPQVRFQVAFNTGGQLTTPPAFVDLSSRLRGSWSAALAGRQYELDQVQSGQLTLTLWNLDGALDPLNGSSPYSPNVIPMRACRLQAVWPPTRNLIPQDRSSGVAPASAWFPFLGSVAPVKGLSAAPTGHTTATAWTFPIVGSLANQYPLLTGTNGGGAEAMSFPVVGGQPYSWSCWGSRSSGGDATLGVTQQVLFYDKTGAQVGGAPVSATLASIPVQGSWALNAASGTAPATAVVARIGTWLTNTATTAVNTVYFTGMQLEQAAAPTPWTAGGVVYPLWAGYVERWPQQWDMSGTYGLVDLTCVDVLAGLAQFTLAPNFQASLQALGPDYIYAFNDASGSTRFADTLGHKPARSVGVSALGAGSGAITAGNSLQGGGAVGVSGPVVTITNSPTGSNANSTGKFIGASLGQVALPASGGWTRLICFRTTASPSGSNYMTLWASTAPAFWSGGQGSQSTFVFGIDNSGHGFGWVTNAANTATSSISVPVVVNDGNWHVLVGQLSADGKTWTVSVDGNALQTTTTLDYHPTGMVTESIGALENHYVDAFTMLFSGDVAYATQYSYAIGATAWNDLGTGFSTGWAGETSAVRAQRILNLAGYGGTIQTQDATLAMGGANLAGTDPMSALTLVGDTEAGQVYVDSAGVLWLTGRQWRYLQANPAVTFGENAGEIPYLGDIALDFDTTHIYNSAMVTQVVSPGFAQPPVQQGNNLASQQAYLPRTIQRSINTQDQTLPQAAAQYLVSQYGQPLARLAALNVDPASNPALWSTVLGLGFGTRAQVNRRPPSGPGAATISVQQFVEHLTWTGDDQGNLKLALQLTPAAPYLNWWVMSSLHTTVATASTAGTATVTLAALTGSANNPAAAVLVPGTVLTLSYGMPQAENLTVKSVATTVAGYTSVAVTFTTNTAFNHAAGDVVCQPLPSGYQLPAATAAGFPASLDGSATLSAAGPRAAY